MRILVVDDSATMRQIVRAQLLSLGVGEIVEAQNGNDAIGKLQMHLPFDIVLLDWNMPEMDGLEFLKKIRNGSACNKMKVIMCTSVSERESVLKAMKAGANNYIVKPFTPEILREKLGL
jgi:two-component system chemotaxis response regulator CheY